MSNELHASILSGNCRLVFNGSCDIMGRIAAAGFMLLLFREFVVIVRCIFLLIRKGACNWVRSWAYFTNPKTRLTSTCCCPVFKQILTVYNVAQLTNVTVLRTTAIRWLFYRPHLWKVVNVPLFALFRVFVSPSERAPMHLWPDCWHVNKPFSISNAILPERKWRHQLDNLPTVVAPFVQTIQVLLLVPRYILFKSCIVSHLSSSLAIRFVLHAWTKFVQLLSMPSSSCMRKLV